jgi:hypothetical protein
MFLKDPVIAGKAIYYLASAPEMAGISGRFFNQTIEEKPAPYVVKQELGEKIYGISEKLIGSFLKENS